MFFTLIAPHILSIDIGPIYDCAKTTQKGIYEYPTINNCENRMNKEEYELKTFTAEVFRYSPTVSKFPIYLCTHYKVTLTCNHENIFVSSVKSRKENEIRIPHELCLAMVWNQIFKTSFIKVKENSPIESIHYAFHALCNSNNKIKDDLPTPTEIVNTEQPLIFEIEGRWRNKISEEYKLLFDRKINETCYSCFPISVTQDNTTQSLLIIKLTVTKLNSAEVYHLKVRRHFLSQLEEKEKNLVSFKMQ